MCSATATNIQLKLLDCCHFTTSEFKPTCPFLSLKQVHFPFSSFSLKTKISPCKIVPFVAQTSDLAQTQLKKEEEESGTEYDEGIEAINSLDEGTEAVKSIDNDEYGEGVEAINSVDEGTEAVKSIDNDGEESYRTATVFVGNLYYDVDSKQLAELFTKAGTVEVCEVMYSRDTGQSRGFGFVTMSSVEEAEKAIEMFQLYKLHGRLLTVQKAAPRGTLPGAYSRELYRVFVGNLPHHVDDVRLEQLFSEHGKVLKARVVYDHYTGTSRGFGFVTMSSEAELNAAVFALDGEEVDGRLLRVSVAHEIGGRVI